MKKIITIATVLAMLAPGFAFADMNSSAITIQNHNSGAVVNMTSATAATGGNTADGSYAGAGGTGGAVAAFGSGNNGGAGSGNGGTGGNAAAGGAVQTGTATADAGALNAVNTNATVVGPGGNMNSSALIVANDNDHGFVMDATRARARTGGNDAAGSYAGDGGRGGAVLGGFGSGNNGAATGGTGGNGGTSGLGGGVVTGPAAAHAGSINVLNTNLTRVNH